MGQTTSSSGGTTNPALSSSDTPSLPSDYYGHASSVASFAPSHHQTGGEDASAPPSDGYRWRKYGQKSVKGSAYARNYYKCTYPGCTVKKQVDKINSNGKIIDQVLCKGEHCHGPPQITRINAHDQQTFRNSVINESLANTEIMVKHEDTPRYPYGHPGMRASGGSGRPRPPPNAPGQLDSLSTYHQLASPYDPPQPSLLLTYNAVNNNDANHFVPTTSKKNILNSDSNHANATKPHSQDNDNHLSSPITKDSSASREGPDNGNNTPNTNHNNTTQGAAPASNTNNTANNTTPNIDNTGATNAAGVGGRALVSQFSATPTQGTPQALVPTANTPVTTVSSPRLVIETNTNVDCLDDGYHWRKYGQKTVKGSPFPRSYYKCTEKGCSVKKQVEQNGTSIVNTYEGTHTHRAPAMDDSSELIKKRRLRRSEGQQEMTPYKRMHKSLDDIPPSHGGSEPKSYRFPDCDTSQANSPHFHNPMPIGSMGSILHHTSHLHSSMHLNLGPPAMYPSDSHAHAFSALSSLGSKVRIDPTPALAPLHSFSHTEHHATSPSHKFSPAAVASPQGTLLPPSSQSSLPPSSAPDQNVTNDV